MGVVTSMLKNVGDPCVDAPLITAVNAVDVSNPVCDTTPWTTRCDVTLSGSLPAGLELWYERRVDRGVWSDWQRTTSTSQTSTTHTGQAGVGGPGSATTLYVQFRVSIVPVGKSTPQCDGPDTTSELSKSANLCTA